MTLFDLFENDPVDEDDSFDEDDPFDDEEEEQEFGPSPSCQELEEQARRHDTVAAERGWPDVEIRVSARRRKTSEAKWVGNRIVVSLPAHLTTEARETTIAWLVDRLVTKRQQRSAVGNDELTERAIALGRQYGISARPTSVRWVTNQSTRWGSCSFHSKEIRLSHRLRSVPSWVLDSVLVHELAHLIHPNHSPAFHRLANGYPRHHEAGIYLAGYGLGLESPRD